MKILASKLMACKLILLKLILFSTRFREIFSVLGEKPSILEFIHLARLFSLLNPIIEPRHEKTNVLVSDQVQYKPGCTATEDGWKLEISDLGSRGIVLSM